jgi:hypothetical protein
VSFAAINLCVASQRMFIVVIVVYFVIDSVRKRLDTPSYITNTAPDLTKIYNSYFKYFLYTVNTLRKARKLISYCGQCAKLCNNATKRNSLLGYSFIFLLLKKSNTTCLLLTDADT